MNKKILTIAVIVAIVTALGVGYYLFFLSSPGSRASADVTVSFPDGHIAMGIGERKSMRLEITPNDTSGKISALEFTLSLDTADEVIDYPGGMTVIPENFNTLVDVDLLSATGGQELRVVYVARSCDLKNGPFIVNIPWEAKSEGRVKVELKDLKLVGPGKNYSYEVTSDTTKRSTTVTVGEGGEVNLNMKLKFQGITAKPVNDKIRVGVSARGGPSASNSPFVYSDFIAGDDGMWSGTVRLPATVVPGSAYRILVKGPHHLAKRVCVSEPFEDVDGAYSCSDGAIELTTGDNVLDFSGVFMLAGDLPLPQNGVLDSEDFVLIQQNLSSVDPGAVGRGDINQDGVVDTQDYSAVSYTRSSNEDEQ